MNGLETIRLSSEARDRLMTLKRRTGLQQWNIICRWAFCLSLAEKNRPPQLDAPADSNVEMTWKTFAGMESAGILIAALKMRCLQEGLPLDNATVAREFRFHLNRGIGYLFAKDKIKSIADLLALPLHSKTEE